MKTRRHQLANQVRELRDRLAAAGGETRKNLRTRLAKTTGELAEAKKKIAEQEQTIKTLRERTSGSSGSGGEQKQDNAAQP